MVKPAAKKGRSGPFHPRRGERHGPGAGRVGKSSQKTAPFEFQRCKADPKYPFKNTFEYIVGT